MSTWDLNRMDYLQLFGDGSDGNVVISVNTSLARDMYYLSLTVNSGVVLNPNGFRIHVADTLSGGATGAIACDGRPNTAPAASNTAGTAGFGSAGGLGQVNAGGAGTSFAANVRIGGLGGAGGAGSSGVGGAAGTGTVPTAAQGGIEHLRVADVARELARPDGVQYNGGTGGGGGGGSNPQPGANAGSGAGIVFVAARRLAVPAGFSITANGSNGANAGGGNRGGGGGGGGGAVIVISTDNYVDLGITVSANGGTGGTGGGGSGINGTAGGAGNVYNLVV